MPIVNGCKKQARKKTLVGAKQNRGEAESVKINSATFPKTWNSTNPINTGEGQ